MFAPLGDSGSKDGGNMNVITRVGRSSTPQETSYGRRVS